MPNINLINGLHCPKKISAKYFLSVEISRPKVKKMEAVNPYITPLRGQNGDFEKSFCGPLRGHPGTLRGQNGDFPNSF